MSKEKQGLPATTAGLVRYFDEYQETYKIQPEWVIGFTVLVVFASYFLRPYIGILFGF